METDQTVPICFLFIGTAICDVTGVGFGVVLEFVKVVVCGAGGEG